MSDHKKYVVTLRSRDDLEDFYHDMEEYCDTHEHVPGRQVTCCDRLPSSRNTVYLLSTEEAENLRQDPRVLSVVLTAEELGLQIAPMFETIADFNNSVEVGNSEQTTDFITPSTVYANQDPNVLPFNKSNLVSTTYLNWGLLRCTNGEQIAGWGSDNIATVNASVSLEAIGRNVDVVIVDNGNPDPLTPEYAVNYDGTGGTRIVSYDWYDLDPLVRGIPKGSSYNVSPADHSTHVTGTVAGNRQGWARGSNIYNISYNVNQVFDYVRVFHETKSVNPSTGLKNPTIMNNSWGYILPSGSWSAASITAVTYRGTRSVAPGGGFTSSQLADWGIIVGTNVPVRYTPTDADLIDAIAAGVISVAAAGNSSWKIDVPSGLDWNNNFEIGGSVYYYHRGSSPAGNDTVLENIVVGAVSTTQTEQKVSFSNCGPGVDLYAPGTYIMSTVTPTYSVKVADSRNPSYYLSKLSGTSMASPQVCGIIACYLELYPRWTQTEAKQFILSYAKSDQLSSNNGGYSDTTDLQGSENLYAAYPRLVATEGVVVPTTIYGVRPTSGQTWPRTRIFRYGS